MVWLLALIGLAVAALALTALALRKRARTALPATPPSEEAPGSSALVPLPKETRHVDFDPIAAHHPDSWRLDDQPANWRKEMSRLGERLDRAGVVEVLFVHGTFVGDDPLSVGKFVEKLGFHRTAERVMRAGSNLILGDYSNFAPEYVRLFEQAIHASTGNATARGLIACSSFIWSSANHHIARVRGAMWLAQRLASLDGGAQDKAKRRRARVLLLGHSHAGQIFALLTQLLEGGEHADLLIEMAKACGEDTSRFAEVLTRVRALELDIVTLGMPSRYAWGNGNGYRALHVVNHRGDKKAPRRLLGILHTSDGDYVQQLGVAGSDFPAWTEQERNANRRLDAALGVGSDIKEWFTNVRRGAALLPSGSTVFVDYRDDSRGAIPNFMDTCFGHGIYTRKAAMLFTLKLVVDDLYPHVAEAPSPALAPAVRERSNGFVWRVAARLVNVLVVIATWVRLMYGRFETWRGKSAARRLPPRGSTPSLPEA
jgi:hypothetical protein